ncbi:MAG TPA: toll/interleukin-1 receptor domain-containing protein [Saprospiraceae bacterium]|nr:toll/interleukin-1 receptor domain-containing protein [Saprospiraceae bacterium]
MSAQSKAFIIYAREDLEMLRELINQLTPLKRNDKLSIWHDERILPGAAWDEEIRKNLNEADIIILIVSPSFLSSDYIDQVEFKLALERHRQGKAIMVPVIARPCLWEEITAIVSLQALPRGGQAISTWTNKDEAFLDVAKGVTKLLSNIHIMATDRRHAIEVVENAILLYDEGRQRNAYDLLIKHAKVENGINPRGFHILGRIYHLGEAGIAVNLEEAIKFYIIAANLGYKFSFNNIGMIYRDKGMFLQAFEWAHKGGEMGDSHAFNLLGIMYNLGEGTEPKKELAKQYFEKAAALDNTHAMYNLARMYLSENKHEEGHLWLKRAAEHGYLNAQLELARLFHDAEYSSDNITDAIFWYEKAAKQGSADADFNLGEIYYSGLGGKTDLVAAKIHYGKAAQKGHSVAQLMLGYIYDTLESDIKSAFRWYQAAADQQNRVAEYNLGVLFENGVDGKPDKVQAIAWYKRSAYQGFEKAINRLRALQVPGY